MGWTEPQYDRARINRAARCLSESDTAGLQYWDALQVVNNWRSSHSFPLNTLQMGLRRKATQIDGNVLVAQRIKRLTSITSKLERFPEMKLTQMQDLGGCRAVLSNVKNVSRLYAAYKDSRHKHKVNHIDDYIAVPKPSGYRGVHIVYKYFSDRNDTYNDLKIEIQLRSKLQHAWATAVETVGTFTQQALKSSQGDDDWLRFFTLASSAIAERERTPSVPGISSGRELVKELRHLAKKMEVVRRLNAYGSALQTITSASAGAHYFILRLEPAINQIRIQGFKANELELASSTYLSVESELKNASAADAVLVSVDSIDALRRAYPNYFLDTGVFVSTLQSILKDGA